ncbi:glycosyltransferase [Proteus alimentorum]|uniref:Glycosyltransferase n=1 Tax=Proteus alimentorum TaxID=1973495 RepID=A0ABS0IRK9_9GAMM|nr:glycosyltransferase [Proteus alimentorum]MBG2875361.1 glycosyltransferase [Proteus alimentorum]MBG2878326.1 glycosyltransferase [Proteus alimentorum]
MKKILFINDNSLKGGSAQVTNDTKKCFDSKGWKSYTFFGSSFYKFSPKNYIFNYNAYKKLKIYLDEIEPDIIHIHNYDNLLSPLVLLALHMYKKKKKSCKIIMTVHDYHIISPSNSLSYYKGKEKKFFKTPPSLIKLLISKLDRRSYIHGVARLIQWYLYYSFFDLRKVIDIYLCPSEFIYNLLPLKNKKIVYNPTNNLISSDNIIKENSFITISFAGRLTKDKGIYDFLESIHKYGKHSKIKIILHIFGEGELKEKILSLEKKLKEKNVYIILHGFQKKEIVQKTLSKSHYILLPSLCYENAPLSLIEGVFYKCKIITMNYGGMKEIAEKTTNSILLNNLKHDEIINMITTINQQYKSEAVFYDNNQYEKYSSEYYYKKIKNILDELN